MTLHGEAVDVRVVHETIEDQVSTRPAPGVTPRVTIRHVAAAAGVSIATVSNVLNGRASVAPELVARVRSVMEDLGYQRDQVASTLRRRQTSVVGLVLPTRLHAFHEILHFGKKLLRLLARTALGHILEIAHHALEIFLAEHLLVLVLSFLRLAAFVLLGELLHEIVERLPQLLHELLDLFFRRTVFERLGELILRFLERTLGV